MSFGISKQKDDISLRLRAHNIKNARQQTRQLELDSRKMEERLNELKIAMGREKEERERQGGGFWQSGQAGKLGSYAQDVLNSQATVKSANRAGKEKSGKRKIKVLKDKPTITPERSKQPGTMANIAQRELNSKDNKAKGPRCGQCEQKIAQVSCVECCEDYCTACFAGFHLRGALRKHSSMPVGSNGVRPFSPRPPILQCRETNKQDEVVATGTDTSTEENPMKVTLTDIDVSVLTSNGHRSSPVGSSSSREGHSLLNGAYDEAESAASFRAAVAAWRNSGSDVQDANKSIIHPKSPAVNMECGTSTTEEVKKPIEIRFHGGTLTYAEKLMLKKHRRTKLGPLPVEDHLSNKQSSPVQIELKNNTYHNDKKHVEKTACISQEEDKGEEEEEEEWRSESRISIIELDDNHNISRHTHGVEELSAYRVTEAADYDLMRIHRKHAFTTPSPTPPTAPKSPVHVTRRHKLQDKSATRRSTSNSQTDKENYAGKSLDLEKTFSKRKSTTGSQIPTNVVDSQSTTDPGILSTKKIPSTPKNKTTPRQRSESRAGSRAKQSSRTPRRTDSRPGSRAKSRALSRTSMFGEGHLTKAPSSSLQEVTRLTERFDSNTQYTRGLGDFFIAGIPAPKTDRVLTPTSSRQKSDQVIGKWKVSNKVYQLGRRSWCPGNSLGETVPNDQVLQHLEDIGVKDYTDFATELRNEDAEKEAVVSYSLGGKSTGYSKKKKVPTATLR